MKRNDITLNKNKYFMCSDLHGIKVSVLKDALLSRDFDFDNKTHILVVAGDITDGQGDELNLLNFLRSMDKQGRFIGVRGNHDISSGDVYTQHLNYSPQKKNINYGPHGIFRDEVNKKVLLKRIGRKNANWLKNLPYQVEFDKFFLGHGFYVPSSLKESISSVETLSIWGSPILLGGKYEDWYNYIPESDLIVVNATYKTLDSYLEQFDKPLFLGHFYPDKISAFGEKYNIKLNEQGFYQYKDLVFLDSGLLVGNDLNIYVWEE